MLHLIKYRSRRDQIIFWGGLVFLGCCELFAERPTGVYLFDPFSGAVIVTALLYAATTAGSYALNYYQAKRRKVSPVDRGRMGDFRLQANGYGEHIMRGYGKFRTAGFVLDATPIVHTTSTTEGRPGGKGAPKPPTPATINHVYTTTADIGVCESLEALSLDLKVTRIWENLETIYDATVSAEGDAFYEAERPGNTIAGGASVVADVDASGGSAVSLPNNGSLQWNGVFGTGVTATLEFYLRTSAPVSVEFTWVGGAGTTVFTANIGSTGGLYKFEYGSAPWLLLSGTGNTVKVKNLSATAIVLDRLGVRISGRATGAVTQNISAGSAAANDTLALYAELPEPDGDGTTTTTLFSGGNAGVRIYNGSETQEPDSAFVAIHGAGNVPAYRGICHVVFDAYVLKEPALPNFSFEVDTGVYDVDDIVGDLYSLVNVGSAKLDVTALSGLALEADEGFLITSREEAGRWLTDLMTAYQFDMPEVDGKVKAVLRSGSSVATVTADELRAHWQDEGEASQSEVDIADVDPLALPSELAVGYMDALLDYHQNTQSATVGSGVFGDRQTVNLSMILTATHARRIAETILWQRHMESRTFAFKVGPKYQKCHPGDVLTVTTTNATHTVRLGEHRWQLMGVQEFEGVRHAASVYTQSIAGSSGLGYEAQIIPYPGNTKLVIMDLSLLRPEDAGDGTQPVKYTAVCLRGEGTWRGAFNFKERPVGSESYTLESTHDLEATIGIIASGTIGTVDKTVWDRSTSFVVDLFPDATLESVTEADALNNPELNLAAIGSGATWYVFQFTTVSAGSPSDPYRARFTVSGLLWDRFGSGVPSAGSLADLTFVLLNTAVKPGNYPLEDINQPRLYKCPTSGQTVEDADTVTFTGQGTSLKPLAPANLRGTRNSAGDLLIQWTRRERFASTLRDRVGTPRNEEAEIYQIEFYSGVTLVRGPERILYRQSIPVLWEAGANPGSGSVVYNTSGSLTVTDGHVGHSPTQAFAQDWALEFQVDGVQNIPGHLGMGDANVPAGSINFVTNYEFQKGASATQVFAVSGADTVAVTVAAGDRLRIQKAGSQVKFYLNYVDETTPAVLVSTISPAGRSFKPYYENNTAGTYYADKCRLLYPTASFLYTVAMQTQDFGSTQSSVAVKVYQESAIVGRGFPAEGNV